MLLLSQQLWRQAGCLYLTAKAIQQASTLCRVCAGSPTLVTQPVDRQSQLYQDKGQAPLEVLAVSQAKGGKNQRIEQES